jgi:hypothetical protein
MLEGQELGPRPSYGKILAFGNFLIIQIISLFG